MSGRLRTFDLRLWVTADPPWPALETFFAEVRELAEEHPGISVRWVGEGRDRHGRPRVHAPPHDLGNDDAGETPA